MNQVTDRKKLRREYLKRKGRAYLATALYGTSVLPSLAGLLICVAVIVVAVRGLIGTATTRDILLLALVTLIPVLLFSRAAWLSWRGLICSREDARNIPYAPPVTLDTIPAEELLVRGSEEPPVLQCTVLLRAARGRNAPKEELLRSTEESNGHQD